MQPETLNLSVIKQTLAVCRLEPDAELALPEGEQELAVYVAEGDVEIEGEKIVIGVSPGNINFITKIDVPLNEKDRPSAGENENNA